MLIGVNRWHAKIGLLWNDKHHSSKMDLSYIKNLNFRFVFFIVPLLVTHYDIETNPGPKSKALNIFHAVTGMLKVFLHMINCLH